MADKSTDANPQDELRSIDDMRPDEEGGPIARAGFDYQDEVAVGFLLEMLESTSLVRVDCETHDDLVLVWRPPGAKESVVEFVQVKAGEEDKLWSFADLCVRTGGHGGISLVEKSLGRDSYKESAQFRLVTLRPVVKELECLAFPRDGRNETYGERCKELVSALDRKFPKLQSKKGNGAEYWVQNCIWVHGRQKKDLQTENLIRLIKLSSRGGNTLLPELAETLLTELRVLVKEAGQARWLPDRAKKSIWREWMKEWWDRRTSELRDQALAPTGGKLRKKMEDALLPEDLIRLAIEMRFDYSREIRSSKYLKLDDQEILQRKVKSEVLSLGSQRASGELQCTDQEFHSLCVGRMNSIGTAGENDLNSAFLMGYMYDIADRCLLKFSRQLT